MEELESVQAAKAAITKIERENVNVHQFFPILKHSFQKPSITEASHFWVGLVSSVSGKAKKSKVVQLSTEPASAKATTSAIASTEEANALLPTPKEEDDDAEQEEKKDVCDELRIFSPDSSSEDFLVSTALTKAAHYDVNI